MNKEIGILGLGSMGSAIALNLKKKYKIFGYDINKYNKIKSSKNFIFVKSLKEIFLDGSVIVFLLIFNFLFKIKFFILVLLRSFSLFDTNWSTLWPFSSSLTIKLMVFFINYNINTICACSSTG